MRKSTLLWLFLALLCSVALFHTSQKVHDSRVKIAQLDRDIAQERESLRVLQAEWSYLNQPSRLQKLAVQYLDLSPVTGKQFATVEDLPLRGTAVDDKMQPKPAKIAAAAPPRTHAAETLRAVPPVHAHAHAPVTASRSRGLSDVFKSLGVE